MSLFEKVEAYLNKNNIELTEQDYTPDGRFELLNDGEKTYIRRWDFTDVKKPTDEDLKPFYGVEQDEEQKDKKNLKKIIKDLRANQITILKKKEFEKMKEKNLFEIGDMFIYNAKLYIITNDNPLQSFPNVIV